MGSKGSNSAGSTNPLRSSLKQLHDQLPRYYYVYIVLVGFFLGFYLLGWMPYLMAWYLFCLFFSPHMSWELCNYLLMRNLRPYAKFPWTFNVTAFGAVLSRVLLIFPLETAMYYIDELFFSGYKKVEIKNPFMIVGQPRSGTTKFESVLEGDEDLICLKLWEVRWPYLCFQYTVDAICYVDSHFLNGSIEKIVRDYKLMHVYNEEGNERATMRRMRWDMGDEDDIIFLFHFFFHFQLMAIGPDPEIVNHLHQFDRLSHLEKRRMFDFHKAAVQKVLMRRGEGKRYFAKWVLTWGGILKQGLETYPDLKLIVIVRRPEDQLRSWFKLQELSCRDLSGQNPLDDPAVLEAVKKINIEFYNNEIEILRNLKPSTRFIINFTDLYRDLQQNTRDIYSFLEKRIGEGSRFDKFLKEQTQQQLTHQITPTNDRYVTDQEIRERFPHLIEILCDPKFGQQP